MPTRLALAHMLPSLKGTNSASTTFYLSRLISAPRITPVYASDLSLPPSLQDSVPACPLWL